jgi:hypothetical protein
MTNDLTERAVRALERIADATDEQRALMAKQRKEAEELETSRKYLLKVCNEVPNNPGLIDRIAMCQHMVDLKVLLAISRLSDEAIPSIMHAICGDAKLARRLCWLDDETCDAELAALAQRATLKPAKAPLILMPTGGSVPN